MNQLKAKNLINTKQIYIDENGYVLDCEIVPGNVHDSQSC